MKTPPRYWEGKPLGSTDLNRLGRVARQGQINAGPGIIVTSTSRGTAVGKAPASPARRIVPTLGGTVVVTEEVTYTDTPVEVLLEPPLTNEILGVPSEGMTAPDAMLDLDSATPAVTLNQPGRYLIHYSATCGYSSACATALNLSDCVSRIRLSIGGTIRDETAAYGTHHAKLCATGLVYGVGGEIGEGLSADGGGGGSGSGAVSGTLDVPVEKVAEYPRWIGSRVTICATFQLLVYLDESGAPKIATGLPPDEETPAPTCAPTVGLVVDRSDIEPAPTVDPLEWLPAASTALSLFSAQIHFIRLA